MKTEQKNNYSEPGTSLCRRIFTWFLQISLWAGFGILIYGIVHHHKTLKTIGIITIGVSYFFYVIIQFYSSTYNYLSNLTTVEDFTTSTKKLFLTAIEVIFNVECYHYETTTVSNGRTTTTTTRRVVTYRGNENFVYNYWKDVSGNLLIDSTTSKIDNSIIFTKLKLVCDYIPHDQNTTFDLNLQRSNFYLRNKNRDSYCDLWTDVVLPEMKEFSLVKISDKDVPFFFGFWWLVIFIFIIPVAQIYKFYVNSICSKQCFIIKKEISTRVNLNLPEFAERFKTLAPKILLNKQIISVYDTNVELNNDVLVVQPNEVDIALDKKKIVENFDIIVNNYVNADADADGNLNVNNNAYYINNDPNTINFVNADLNSREFNKNCVVNVINSKDECIVADVHIKNENNNNVDDASIKDKNKNNNVAESNSILNINN